MHLRPRSSIALTAAAGLLLTAVPLAHSVAASAPARAAVTPRSHRVVSLPTGDQVRLVPDLHGKAGVLTVPAAATGPGHILTTRHLGSDTYVIPAVAEPYLGRFLDPGLFDVTRLAAAATPQGWVPVTISYSGSAPSVPGVTITSASKGTASGYLTPDSGAAFGRALTTQWKSDAKAHWPARTTLFPGVTKIAANIPGGGVVTPKFPMFTLVVKAIGADGKPLQFGFGILINADDGRKYGGFIDIENGEARVSVPAGNYTGIFDDFTFDDATNTGHITVTPVLQYAVKGAGQTLTVDHRTATVAAGTATVPKASTLSDYTFEWDRTDEAGFSGVSSSYGAGPDDDLRIAPSGPATVGTLNTVQTWNLAGPGTTPAYTYIVSAASDRVAKSLDQTFTAGDLATVKSRYFTDGPTHPGEFLRFPVYPFQFFVGGSFSQLTLPAKRTEYVGAKGSPQWGASLIGNDDSFDDPIFVDDIFRTLAKGSTSSADWLRGPLAAGVPFQAAGGFNYCYACRSGNTMAVVLAGVLDSTPGHTGEIFGAVDGLPVARFRLYQNDALVFDQDDYLGAIVDVPAAKTSYKAILDLDRRLTQSTQSTRTSTELTFSSSKGAGPVSPSDWFCDAGTSCRILPVVQAKLSLPTSLTGTLPAGKSTVTVTAGRIQGAAASAVTSSSLEIRAPGWDWTTVKLTSAGGGKYTGVVDNTDFAGQTVDVRLSAADAGGSTFKQTVLKAYTVASA